MQQLLGSVAGNHEAMDGFVSVVAGTVSPVKLFFADNIRRITQAAAQPAVVGLAVTLVTPPSRQSRLSTCRHCLETRGASHRCVRRRVELAGEAREWRTRG